MQTFLFGFYGVYVYDPFYERNWKFLDPLFNYKKNKKTGQAIQGAKKLKCDMIIFRFLKPQNTLKKNFFMRNTEK